MTVALYMEEQVPKAITLGLQQRNVDVISVQEDGRSDYADSTLLDRATELERVMFSQDDDFLAEAHHRQMEGIDFAGVIYAHQKNVSLGDCIRDLEIVAKVLEPEDCANLVHYLPL